MSQPEQPKTGPVNWRYRPQAAPRRTAGFEGSPGANLEHRGHHVTLDFATNALREILAAQDFGGRDSITVLHATRKVKDLYVSAPGIGADYRILLTTMPSL